LATSLNTFKLLLNYFGMDYSEPAILVSHVTKYLGGFKIIKDITFTVFKGEKVLITGPSRSGKTTIIKVILDILNRDSGFIEVLGIDPMLDRVGVLKRVGYIPQRPNLPKRLKLTDILNIKAHLLGVKPDRLISRAKDILNEIGLKNMLLLRGGDLNPSKAKTFYTVYALVNDPEIIFIDEPLDYMDGKTGEYITRYINENDKTVIVSSRGHGLEMKYDKIIRISEGKIIEISGSRI